MFAACRRLAGDTRYVAHSMDKHAPGNVSGRVHPGSFEPNRAGKGQASPQPIHFPFWSPCGSVSAAALRPGVHHAIFILSLMRGPNLSRLQLRSVPASGCAVGSIPIPGFHRTSESTSAKSCQTHHHTLIEGYIHTHLRPRYMSCWHPRLLDVLNFFTPFVCCC